MTEKKSIIQPAKFTGTGWDFPATNIPDLSRVQPERQPFAKDLGDSDAESVDSVEDQKLAQTAAAQKAKSVQLAAQEKQLRDLALEIDQRIAACHNQEIALKDAAAVITAKQHSLTQQDADFQRNMKALMAQANQVSMEKETALQLMKKYSESKYADTKDRLPGATWDDMKIPSSTGHSSTGGQQSPLKERDRLSHRSPNRSPSRERRFESRKTDSSPFREHRSSPKKTDRSLSRERRPSPPKAPLHDRDHLSPQRRSPRSRSHDRRPQPRRQPHRSPSDDNRNGPPFDYDGQPAFERPRHRSPQFRNIDFSSADYQAIQATVTQPYFHSTEENQLISQQAALVAEDRALKLLRLQIDEKRLQVRNDPTHTSLELLATMEDSYMDRNRTRLAQQEQLDTAKKIAAKYEVFLEMPQFRQPPRSFRRPLNAMEIRSINAAVPTYDPAVHPDRDFSQVWMKIVDYGESLYLEEDEYIRILSAVSHGPAFTTLKEMRNEKKTLRQILDYFAVSACKQVTILDHQAAVDNFVRVKGETLKQTMNRAENAVNKLVALYEPMDWPVTKRNMLKSLLKQVLATDTKQHMNLIEAKASRLGGKISMEAMINQLHQYELTHDKIPTKDTATTFQVASLETKPSVYHTKLEGQLQALKKDQMKSKNMEEQMKQFIQTASAHFPQRGRSPENMGQKSGRSPAHRPRTPSASALPDTDTAMNDLTHSAPKHDDKSGWNNFSKNPNKDYRADKPDNEKRRQDSRSDKRQSDSHQSERQGRSDSRGNNSNNRNYSGSRDNRDNQGQRSNSGRRFDTRSQTDFFQDVQRQFEMLNQQPRQQRDRSSSQDRRNGRSNTPGRDSGYRSRNSSDQGSRPQSRERTIAAPMVNLALAIMDNMGMQQCVPCSVFYIKNSICPNSRNHSEN